MSIAKTVSLIHCRGGAIVGVVGSVVATIVLIRQLCKKSSIKSRTFDSRFWCCSCFMHIRFDVIASETILHFIIVFDFPKCISAAAINEDSGFGTDSHDKSNSSNEIEMGNQSSGNFHSYTQTIHIPAF